MVEWLKRRAYDQYGLDLKPTGAILLCPWERQFRRALRNCKADSNILASPEAGGGNFLPFVLAPPSENKYRDKINKINLSLAHFKFVDKNNFSPKTTI